MPDLAIPTVTSADLLAFHAKHLGPLPSGTPDDGHHDHGHNGKFAEQHLQTELADSKSHDEPDLGYYADGVPRTLTNAQIQIFRHSEIHRLRMEQERARELAAESPRQSPSQKPADEDQAGRPDFDLSEGEIIDDSIPGARGGSTTNTKPDDREDEEEEYAQFLRDEQRQYARQASTTTKPTFKSSALDWQDRTVSTRRRVRELDQVTRHDQVLSYDDEEPPPPAAVSSKSLSTSKEPGRRIWWPIIQMPELG